MVDATTEYLSEQCNTILERVVGSADSDKFANCIQSYVLAKCHNLLLEQSGADRFVKEVHPLSCSYHFIYHGATGSIITYPGLDASPVKGYLAVLC